MSFQYAKELLLTLTRLSQFGAFLVLFLLFCSTAMQPLLMRDEGLYGVDATGAQRSLVHPHPPHPPPHPPLPPPPAPQPAQCKRIIHDDIFNGQFVRYVQYNDHDDAAIVAGAPLQQQQQQIKVEGEAVNIKDDVAIAMPLTAIQPLQNVTPDDRNKTPIEVFDVCVNYHYVTSVSLFVSVFSKVTESEKKKKIMAWDAEKIKVSPLVYYADSPKNHSDSDDDDDGKPKPHPMAYVSLQMKEFFNFHVLESKRLIETLVGFSSFTIVMVVLSFLGCVVSLFKSTFLCSSHIYSPWGAVQRHRRRHTPDAVAVDENGNALQVQPANIVVSGRHSSSSSSCCSCRCCCLGCHLCGGFGGIFILLLSLVALLACARYDRSVHTHLLHPRFDRAPAPGGDDHHNETNVSSLFVTNPMILPMADGPAVVPDNETYESCHYIDGCVTSFDRDGFRPTVAPMFDLLWHTSLFIFITEVVLCVLGGSRYYVERARRQEQQDAYEEEENEADVGGHATDIVIMQNDIHAQADQPQQQQQQQQQQAAAAGRNHPNINNVMDNNNNNNNNKKGVKAKNGALPTRGEEGMASEREPLIP